jgi:uncharacterized protein
MPVKPVTIAVMADTHAKRIEDLPPGLLEALSRADAVIHLGDYTTPELLNGLKRLDNFYGVTGNHDGSIVRQGLNMMEVVELGGRRLGLIHGLFLPLGRPKRMKALFKKYKIDILLFGHNHLATSKMSGGVLLFNPGTVTGQFPATYASFGWLTLDGTIQSEIIPLEIKSPPGYRRYLGWLAFIIRNGMRCLEVWPYIDLSPVRDKIDMIRNKLPSAFKARCRRQKMLP